MTMKGREAHRAQASIDALFNADDVGSALRALMAKADDEAAEPFERYAGLVLRDAGAANLTTRFRLQRVADGQLVRLHPASPSGDDGLLRIVEDALNRLLGVSSALANGIGGKTGEAPMSKASLQRQIYERQGLEYPLWSNPTRGAHVKLPPLALNQKPSLAYFNEIDWRMLDNVASIAHLHYQSAILVNSNQVVFGVKGPHGSEWDVRTRLASSLENIWPSLHLTYRFDCDLSRNTATVHFTIPPLESFPADISPRADGSLKPAGNRIANARTAYCLRLAALIAATCFGAGRTVESAFIVGLDEKGDAAIACSFTRRQFVHETLPAIDAGQLAAPELRFNPDGVQKTLAACTSDYTHIGASELRRENLGGIRLSPHQDTRTLPADMQRLFHARRICDIDVSRYHGGSADAIDEARKDSRNSAVAVIARLENIVEELESSLEAPPAIPDARPLHCENALQRVAIVLLDDELSIGADAEAFLSFDDKPDADDLPDVVYYRAPSALYHAHVGLADSLHALEDERGAEAHADRCIALGPTTPIGYALKAGVLAREGKTRQAANVIMTGLRSALGDNDRALLLFELAFLFRRMGKFRESEALYICSATMKGPYAQRSLEVIEELEEGVNPRAFAHANLAKAISAITEMGIPFVTDRFRKVLVSRAALGLVNAHAPRAAAPYATMLQECFPDNRAIIGACNSIRFGLGD